MKILFWGAVILDIVFVIFGLLTAIHQRSDLTSSAKRLLAVILTLFTINIAMLLTLGAAVF